MAKWIRYPCIRGTTTRFAMPLTTAVEPDSNHFDGRWRYELKDLSASMFAVPVSDSSGLALIAVE